MANTRADYKLGVPIDKQVADKIKALQTVFGDTTDSTNRQAYIQLQQSTPWIRMQSGVKLDEEKAKLYGAGPGFSLAKRNILFGLNTRVDSQDDKGNFNVLQSYSPDDGVLPGYEVTSNFGIRPRPGITNMNIHSHNRFGSLRTAVVNFQCWSKEQIDALEVLYMRPGYTVLLEWGHSKNLRVKADGTATVEDMDLGLDLYKYNTAESLRNAILTKKKTNHFGYDAIVGTIKNFSWKLRKDGGYDCSTSLVTAGDLIESYKANFFLSQTDINDELQEELKKAAQNNNVATQGTRFIFPTLHKDTAQTAPPDIGPVLGDLMKNWAYQANNSLKKIAEYLRGEFISGNDYDTEAKRETKLKYYLKAQHLGTNAGTAPHFMTEFVDKGIDNGNVDAVVAAFADLVESLEVVDTTQEVHRFQGYGHEEVPIYHNENAPGPTPSNDSAKLSYSPLPTPNNIDSDFVGVKAYKISLQTQFPVLVDFFDGEKNPPSGPPGKNGFGQNEQPDLNLPGGGRAAFQIPFKKREALVDALISAIDRHHFGGAAGYRQTHEIRSIFGSDPSRFPMFQIYGLLGNLVSAVSEEPAIKGSNTGALWQFQVTNNGDKSGTGLTLDTDDTTGGSWNETAENLNRKWHELHASDIIYADTYRLSNNLTTYKSFRWFSTVVKDESTTGIYNSIPEVPLPPTYGEYRDDAYLPSATDFRGRADRTYDVHTEGIARFMVMKWNGYDSSAAPAPATNASGVDETGETYVIHDPNDDYVSKLHFYLRVLIEAKYTSEYLSTNLLGQSFSQTFRFRDLPEYTNVLKKIFKNGAPIRIQDQLRSLIGGRFVSEAALDIRNHVYIPLGVLLEILNNHILRSDSEYFFEFQTTYTGKQPEYLTFDDHISMDPRVCILPHNIHEILDPGNIPSSIENSPTILNIQLSINYILDTLNKYISKDGKAPMYDFIETLLDGVAKVSGGQNDFQLQYAEEDAVFHVVDRRSLSKTPYADLKANAEINIFGLNSIVRDVNLISQLSPKMSSMIAISAQDSPYTSQDEATGFNGINRGITDLIYTERYDVESKETKEESNIDSYKEAQEALRKKIVGVIAHLGMFYAKCLVPRHSVETMIGSYQNYCKFLFGADTEFNRVGQRSTYSFIIPFELHLSLYGISNLRVMDSFVINKDLLPNTYGGDPSQRVGFLITGVEHQVDKSNWTTKLKTQIFNVEDHPNTPVFTNLKTDFEEAVKRIQVYNPGGGGSGTGAPGKNGRLDDSELTRTKAGYKLLTEAAIKFDEMYDDANAAGLTLDLVGGYRTFERQNEIFDWDLYVATGGSLNDTSAVRGATRAKSGSNGGTAAAFPGTSNHGWGTAIDVARNGSAGDLAIYWVMKNGYNYGWSWYEGHSINEHWHFTFTKDSNLLKEYPLDSSHSRITKFSASISSLTTPTSSNTP
jgi:LAS superfamily LD-carboxypeptidase LdcB